MKNITNYLGLLIIIVFAIVACNPIQELPSIYVEEPQGALHPYCVDSAYLLSADDVLATYESFTLEEVFTVDSLTNSEALVRRIYSTSPDSPLCNQAEWRAWFDNAQEKFEVRCKEDYAQFILDVDTCQ